MAEVNGIKVPFIPITNDNGLQSSKTSQTNDRFDRIFKQELDKIKFSGHAQKRLEARNIQLSENDLTRIQTAVQKAERKGSRDSLVMMNDTAFVVNIPNKTVVTTMQVSNENENIFTNIDSVVFI